MKGGGGGEEVTARLRTEVDSMLEAMQDAHKGREEQLSEAAQEYKEIAELMKNKYEQLYAAYW